MHIARIGKLTFLRSEIAATMPPREDFRY